MEEKGAAAEGAGGAPYLLWFTKKFVSREKEGRPPIRGAARPIFLSSKRFGAE